ncbi:NADPH-dependent D-xylose reductase II [Diplonema papillatum]|nr:NADPH-dependent D-xylose reductase II [Diplonema papillatum]
MLARHRTTLGQLARNYCTAPSQKAAPQPDTLPTVQLNSGSPKRMPMIGCGTFTGTRKTQKVEEGAMKANTLKWFSLGGRMLDAAQNYLNEAEIGEAIEEAIRTGLVTRDEIWVTSKLNNPYHRKEHVRPALEKSLLDLGVDYIDLYLMHWPTAFVYVPFGEDKNKKGFSLDYEPDMCSKVTGVEWSELNGRWPPPHLDYGVSIHETWGAMVELHKEGLIKNIGVCNTPVALLHELIAGSPEVKPAVVQHEAHPYCQQWGLLKYCQMNGIQFQGYSPLGYGFMASAAEVSVLRNPHLERIAAKHGLQPGPGGVAAVCLQWATQRGSAAVPMTLHETEMRANLATGSLLELDEEDLRQIGHLDRNHHYLRPEDWYGLPYWA